MIKITNGIETLEVTEKAFDVIYKNHDFYVCDSIEKKEVEIKVDTSKKTNNKNKTIKKSGD